MWLTNGISCKWVNEDTQPEDGFWLQSEYPELEEPKIVEKTLVDQIIDDPKQLAKLKAELSK